MGIGNSSLFWDWIKANSLSTFIIISILIHFIFLGITRYWKQTSVVDGIESIDFDYYEIHDEIIEEDIVPTDHPPVEENEDLPEPEYSEEVPPPLNEIAQIESENAVITLPPFPEDDIDPELTRARALGKYISYLQDIIDLQLEYPDRASREGREGEVTVLFTLDKTGRLLALSIPAEGKSAFHPFNRAAMSAVRQSARYFDAFPEVITEETITFRLPITFSLN